MEEIKLTKQEQDYENAIGLLSFENDATEEFTPDVFNKLSEEYRPVFVIRPFKPNEREKYQKTTAKLSRISGSDYDYSDKIIKLNKEISEEIACAVLDIKNFHGLRSDKTFVKVEFEKENGHIKTEDIHQLPEFLKNLLYVRIQAISGFSRSSRAAL